jgi:hypothetical protein
MSFFPQEFMESVGTPSQQVFQNGEIHDWYRLIWGYSDHLVSGLLDRFDLSPRVRVLDPFCGAGTTLVECAKRGISASGIDANPASLFAARVKTNWSLRGDRLMEALDRTTVLYRSRLRSPEKRRLDPTYVYLSESGMIQRGWISLQPLHKALSIKSAIRSLQAPRAYKDALMLALISEVVSNASNVKFGPELYCGPPKEDVDVLGGFIRRVVAMVCDLTLVDGHWTSVQLWNGDSRVLADLRKAAAGRPFRAVVCSPPYPAEHDYTRNSRLELAFLEEVTDIASLRSHKKKMIRSHTKNIYVDDDDGVRVRRLNSVSALVREIDHRVRDKDHGFARYYSAVIQQYFGGMRRHLEATFKTLAKGAQCAYVVGDQASYANVPIPTAEILGQLAELSGFRGVHIEHWRSRRSSTTSRVIGEHILLFRRP